MDSLKSMRWTLFTTGGVLIALGVLSLLYSITSLLSLALFVGIGLVLVGVNHLVPYFSMKGDALRPVWFLPQGFVDVLLGFVLVARIGLTGLMIPILLGLWMAFMGMSRFIGFFFLARTEVSRRWVMLLGGLLTLACGLLVLCSPVLAGGRFVSALITAAFFATGLQTVFEGQLVYAPIRRS